MNNLLNRVIRLKPQTPWEVMDQPIPLIKVVPQPVAPGSSSIRYVATGITKEAETVLAQLSIPIYIVAFSGFGRSGKSYTATTLRAKIAGNNDHKVKLISNHFIAHIIHSHCNIYPIYSVYINHVKYHVFLKLSPFCYYRSLLTRLSFLSHALHQITLPYAFLTSTIDVLTHNQIYLISSYQRQEMFR